MAWKRSQPSLWAFTKLTQLNHRRSGTGRGLQFCETSAPITSQTPSTSSRRDNRRSPILFCLRDERQVESRSCRLRRLHLPPLTTHAAPAPMTTISDGDADKVGERVSPSLVPLMPPGDDPTSTDVSK